MSINSSTIKGSINGDFRNKIPMTLREFKQRFEEKPLEPHENGDEEGYAVEHHSPESDHDPMHEGKFFWISKEHLHGDVHQPKPMDFGAALKALRNGQLVARAGWNGKGMWLSYVTPYKDAVHMARDKPMIVYRAFVLDAAGDPSAIPDLLPYIGMRTADNSFVPWLASQTDILAMDWRIVSA